MWHYVANYDRQANFERDLLFRCSSTHSIAYQHTALLTLQDCSMSPMEVDAAYQGCLSSCKLHSRSFAVRHTGACDLEIVHTWFTQSRECTHMVYAISRLCTVIPRLPAQSQNSGNAQRNLKIAQILRLR